ncbi:hypothetical protein G7K71_08185 [Desulfofundulus sp. TPOSR]|nr:hypothetical protein [Desulfofundulus sp. TPOSR]NHM26961.1 hypothetical protein [Desulfofundulus sp. TPOSR]
MATKELIIFRPIYNLWFRFAKKRILETQSVYEYGYADFRVSSLFTSITAVIGGLMFYPYYLRGDIGNYEAFLLMLVFVVIKFGLTHIVGISLQETVFILDLPSHLKGRVVYGCYNFAKKEAVEKKDNQNSADNIGKQKRNVFLSVCRFVNHAFKLTIAQFFSKTIKTDGSLSHICKSGNRDHISHERIEVGERKTQQNYFANTGSVASKKIEYPEKDSICHWSSNKGKEQPWTEWRRHFWLCESCTVSTIGEQAKPEYGISYFDGKKNPATSHINPSDRNSQGEVHTSMANFVQKDRKVMAHQHGNDKCQYFHHLINQLPVEKLRFGTKLLIIISSPVWLIHLLFDKRDLRIIDTVKYRDWEADHFGKICFDPRMPREMEKDIAINETVTSAIGFCSAFLVLMALK